MSAKAVHVDRARGEMRAISAGHFRDERQETAAKDSPVRDVVQIDP
jgi:hypothetical protein